MTSQFELVWLPLLLAIVFLLMGIRVLYWRKMNLNKVSVRMEGSGSIRILGLSSLLLFGFCLFVGLFFLITG